MYPYAVHPMTKILIAWFILNYNDNLQVQSNQIENTVQEVTMHTKNISHLCQNIMHTRTS